VCRLESAPASVTCGADASIGADSEGPGDVLGGDTTSPTIVISVPAPGATNVARASSITVTFSEPVFDVSPSSFYAYADALVVDGSIMAVGSPPDFTSYAFTPDAPMPGNTNVTVVLTSVIHDTAGNALVTTGAGSLNYTFTTEP
jgi:hypothetical protein